MKILLTSLIIVLSLVSTSLSQWKQCNGPFGGKVSLLAVNGTTLFAGTQESGVYRSTNNGDNWVQVNNGLTNKAILALTVSQSVVFASTKQGIFRSTDNGDTWKTIKHTAFNNKYIYYMVACSALLFASGSDPYMSSDKGETWKVLKEMTQVQAVVEIDTTILIIDVRGCFRSNDKGSSWVKVSGQKTFILLSSCTVVGTTIYLAGERGIEKSTDMGQNWVEIESSSGWYFHRSACISSIGNRLFASSARNDFEVTQKNIVKGVYKSTNLGISWVVNYKGLADQEVNALAVIGTTLFAATYGGVFRSTDDGINWKAINSGLTNQYIQGLTIAGNTLYASMANDGKAYKSTDNGNTWSELMLTYDRRDIRSVVMNEETVIVGTFEDGLFRSLDGGITWIDSHIGSTKQYIYQILVLGTAIFAATDDGVFTSTNNGGRWVKIPNEFKFADVSKLFLLDDVLHACTTNGSFQSTDNGVTWTAGVPCADQYAVLKSTNGNTLFYARNGGGVFRSIDNGKTWKASNYDMTNLKTTSIVSVGAVLFVGTEGNGVFHSTDSGETWSTVNTSLGTRDISTLTVVGTTIYVGTKGAGIWKTEVDDLLDVQYESEQRNSNLICYPNPTSNTITIDRAGLQFNNITPVNYTLSTLTGNIIMEFELSESKFSIPLNGFLSGVYCLTAMQGMNRSAVMVTVVE